MCKALALQVFSTQNLEYSDSQRAEQTQYARAREKRSKQTYAALFGTDQSISIDIVLPMNRKSLPQMLRFANRQ